MEELNDETYRDAYRWDPVGMLPVESQLLALEDYALYQPGAFRCIRATEQALNRLICPAVGYGVSLIEDTVEQTILRNCLCISLKRAKYSHLSQSEISVLDA